MSTSTKTNGEPPAAEAPSSPGAAFPKLPLVATIRVSEAIERANGGQPYPPTETALAMDLSPQSGHFRTLLASSSIRGLTTGSHGASRIALQETGRDIVAPTSPEARQAALVRAALAPAVFQAVYSAFRGKRLPDDSYFTNTLHRDFAVPIDKAAKCAEVFRADMEYVGLTQTSGTGDVYLRSEAVTTAGATTPVADDEDIESSLEDDPSEVPSVPGSPVAPVVQQSEQPKRPKKIFVGHGPEKTAVTQLTKILTEYALPHVVVDEEPNAGRPISKKVTDALDECGAAILIFTRDRELRDLDGNTVWLSSPNVSHELGAAAWAYDNRVVIFKEQGVDLPSNFSGIGYIEFETGKLADRAVELFRELVKFGLVKISVGE
jgi:Predicted nucleotide-binding protein containing TIR-like domain